MSGNLTIVTPENYLASIEQAVTGSAIVALNEHLEVLRPELPVTEPEAALIVTTSGSTGVPKAVVLSRSALQHAVAATNDRLGGAGDWVCALPIQFVAGTMTLVRAVMSGRSAQLVAGDLSDLPNPRTRTYISLVPTQLSRALADPSIMSRLANYGAVLVGGSALSAELREVAVRHGINLVATYGLAETCGGCVYDGYPLPGVSVRLDAQTRVWLDTPSAFSGYRLRPDLTAETLVSGWVRTADRGQMIGERLTVTGRLDETAIIGGVNVDVAHLRQLAFAAWGDPLLGGVALVAVPDPRWGQVIVALTTSAVTLPAVRAALPVASEALPRRLHRVDSLPVTGTGKIDYRKTVALANSLGLGVGQ